MEENYQYDGGEIYVTSINDKKIGRSFSNLNNDPLFTNMFNYNNIFGNQYGTYSGKSFTFANFLDYHSTLSSYYSIVQSTNIIISSVNGNIYDKHHMYISSKYSNVFSSDMIENKLYMNSKSLPVSFTKNAFIIPGSPACPPDSEECECKCYNFMYKKLLGYYSCLPVNTIINTLDYRLGIHTNNIFDLTTTNTYFDIVGNTNYDFLMQLNPEQSFNNMDISMPENYNITNETTGQSKIMYAKILTGGFGSGEVSQTCIQNPIIFRNTLGKLDKLIFKIYLDDEHLTPMWLFSPFISQVDEWNATFQIDEEIGYADRTNGWGRNPTITDNSDNFKYMGPWIKKG